MKRLISALLALTFALPVRADLIQQSTTYTRMVYMQDSTTTRSPGVAGLTLTITASKAGAAFAAITPTVTDRGGGWYSLLYTTTHTNTLGVLALKITGTGADETDTLDQIVAFNPNDAAALGLTNIDAAISSRSTFAAGQNVGTATSVTGSVGSVVGAVGSVTSGVTVTTNNDKAGYALSIGGVQSIWDALTSNLTTVGSVGKYVTQTLSTYAGADTAGTTTLLSRIPGTVAAQSGDAYARIGLAGVGLTNLGDTRIANLDATVSSRSVYAGGAVASVTGSVGSVTSAVTVGGYATGQDPATLVLAGVVDGTLTVKQQMAISRAVLAGVYPTVTRDSVAKTLTVVYKRMDNSTTIETSVTTYSDSGLTLPVSRTVTYSNLP